MNMKILSRPSALWSLLPALAVLAALLLAPGGCAKAKSKSAGKNGTVTAAPAKPLPPVYIHMNGFNAFVEAVVAVEPGQPVIFVNQDTGPHTIQGYNPVTGKPFPAISGMVMGTPGPGHKVSTYKVVLKKPGIYCYYCSMHAELQRVYHRMVQPAHRQGVHGFAGAMAGVIVVTREKSLLQSNPPTCHQRILKGYFGG
jgi:plastocyanin